jgi:hypothetical protein
MSVFVLMLRRSPTCDPHLRPLPGGVFTGDPIRWTHVVLCEGRRAMPVAVHTTADSGLLKAKHPVAVWSGVAEVGRNADTR